MYFNRKRPSPVRYPGQLVQVDTIHFVRSDYTRFYIYTLIDVYSRAAYVQYSPRAGQKTSAAFVVQAQKYLNFSFELIQTDNGKEFGQSFRYILSNQKIAVRHTRVKKPNDNAHIERFNRTLKDELIRKTLPKEVQLQAQLKKYLQHYNNDRPHLSLNCKSPSTMLQRC